MGWKLQNSFEFIKPEDKTKYFVKCEGYIGEAWFMNGKFIFNNYYYTDKAVIIERIGTPKEVFK